MSNGETAARDGRSITLNGVAYPKGLGVHAPSSVQYYLRGVASRFQSAIGVDDEAGANGTVVFQVWADGAKLFDSGVMTGSSPTRMIDVDLTGRNTVTLVVTEGGDGMNYDHADWAGARLLVPGIRLNATLAGNLLAVSWPNWATAYTLWYSTNLASSATWLPVTNDVQNTGTLFTVTLPLATNSSRFYRLQVR